ncbi:MAG: DUF6093 family protein [Dermatophilaceae bacterium]
MIGDVITAALPLLRANALSLMTDTCNIDRLTTTWDEALQKSVTDWTTVHAAIPCHLEEPTANAQSIVTGETVTLENPLVKTAHTINDVQPNDRVTVGVLVLWVTRAAHDDSTHPVEYLIQCRWSR